MRMLPAGYFIVFSSARPAGLCTTAPAFRRPATKPLTIPAAGSLSYCGSSIPLPPAVRPSPTVRVGFAGFSLSVRRCKRALLLFFILSGCTRSVLCSCCTLSCHTASTTRYHNRCPPDAPSYFLSGYNALPDTWCSRLIVSHSFVSCPAPAQVMLARMSARGSLGSLSTAPTTRRFSFALISSRVNFVSVLVLGLAGNGQVLLAGGILVFRPPTTAAD